jgi:MYXO-CTERM domain-containing protein
VLARTAGVGNAIAVDYRTVDDGAIAGRDYVASVGRLDWAAGDASDKTITIEILQSPDSTSFRKFSLQLAPASGGPVMLDQEGTIWIEPSQPASPSPTPPPAATPTPPPATPPAPGSVSGQHSGGGGGGSTGPALLSLLALLLLCARRRNLQLSLATHH